MQRLVVGCGAWEVRSRYDVATVCVTVPPQPATVHNMTRTTSAPPIDVDYLMERVRENVRMLKVLRKRTDEQLATLGNYSSRQIVADRLSGRTPIDLQDVVRLAVALNVPPELMQASKSDLMAWYEDHPEDPQPATKLAPTPRKKSPARKR
jgi:transcriptional regulator with XRE-family HTH domain